MKNTKGKKECIEKNEGKKFKKEILIFLKLIL